MTRLKASDSGTLIWDALASGVHLNSEQICLLTGLTRSQFLNGLEWVKDVFQEEQIQPISYEHRTHMYFLAEEWRDVRDYSNWTLRGLVTRQMRLSHTLGAAAAKYPSSGPARRVKRHSEMLVEDLEDMLREVSNSHQKAK